ncbi:unnamed protein product [Ectocarpus sp. CCAP 1310/34]|nr:unnamed protein product [Ectocarpus sp. CCAP 1310/34]
MNVDKILATEVFGGCEEVHPWAALSKFLSVTIKMLSEFPGLQCEVVEFSDEKFLDGPLQEQFAENAEKVTRQGCALWPGMNYEVAFLPQAVSGTPWYQDVKTWVGAASVACLTVFGVFVANEDDDPRLWGVILGFGVLFIGAEFVVIARENKRLCRKPRVEAASAVQTPSLSEQGLRNVLSGAEGFEIVTLLR